MATVVGFAAVPVCAQIPENWRRENIVAWCIVPFDSKNRTPAERAEMLTELRLTRCAYDWRAEHVDQFEEEILEYRQHGIELLAFWDHHDGAFELFQKHGLRPQIWKTLTPQPAGETPEQQLESAVAAMLPLAQRTGELGFPLGLYNHGGWGGEPKNLVAVCRALRARGCEHVGIVYNFHHGHDHIDDFDECFSAMKPFLLCLNLNGMVELDDIADGQAKKILPIGSGKWEQQMIEIVLASGYDGPIGVIGHVAERDVAEVLRENLEGLEKLLK